MSSCWSGVRGMLGSRGRLGPDVQAWSAVIEYTRVGSMISVLRTLDNHVLPILEVGWLSSCHKNKDVMIIETTRMKT